MSVALMLMVGWVPIVTGLGVALWLDARGVGAPALEHECAWCRYDLRGTHGGRCPECGGRCAADEGSSTRSLAPP